MKKEKIPINIKEKLSKLKTYTCQKCGEVYLSELKLSRCVKCGGELKKEENPKPEMDTGTENIDFSKLIP